MSGECRFHQLSAELTCDCFLDFTASHCLRSLCDFVLSLPLLYFISHLWQRCLRRIIKCYALFVISRASAIGPSATSPSFSSQHQCSQDSVLFYLFTSPLSMQVFRLHWRRVFAVTQPLSLAFSTCLCCWCRRCRLSGRPFIYYTRISLVNALAFEPCRLLLLRCTGAFSAQPLSIQLLYFKCCLSVGRWFAVSSCVPL